jgi:hypothetical protein
MAFVSYLIEPVLLHGLTGIDHTRHAARHDGSICNKRGASVLTTRGPSRLNDPRRAWSGLGLPCQAMNQRDLLVSHHHSRFLHQKCALVQTYNPSSPPIFAVSFRAPGFCDEDFFRWPIFASR